MCNWITCGHRIIYSFLYLYLLIKRVIFFPKIIIIRCEWILVCPCPVHRSLKLGSTPINRTKISVSLKPI